jgi:hypothetical protein
MKYLAHILVVAALVSVLAGGYAAVLVAVTQQATWSPNPAVITFTASPGNGFTTVDLTCSPGVIHARLVARSDSPSMNIFTYPYPDTTFVCNSTATTVYIGANCLLNPADSCGPPAGSKTPVTYTGTVQCVNDDQYQVQCGPTEAVRIIVTANTPANQNTIPVRGPMMYGLAPTIFYSIVGGLVAIAVAGVVAIVARKKFFPKLAK